MLLVSTHPTLGLDRQSPSSAAEPAAAVPTWLVTRAHAALCAQEEKGEEAAAAAGTKGKGGKEKDTGGGGW
jgi:hypothetical protein